MGQINGCHKIVKTNDPERRCGALSVLLPVILDIVHVVPADDMAWLEAYLHAAFSHRRVRGEWFRLTEEEIALFKTISAATSETDIPSEIVSLYQTNQAATVGDSSVCDTIRVMDADRSRQGVSVPEWSRRSGVPYSTIQDLRSGRRNDPQFSIVLKLLFALGRGFEWLEGEGILARPLKQQA